jgi:lysozyme
MDMQYSLDGLHLTEDSEGVRLTAYPDPGTGGYPWTIGYGHTRGVQPGDTCTQEQAEQWLREDIAEAVAAVNRLVKVPLTQHEFDALVDFTFNVGEVNFANSTLLKDLNAGYTQLAANEFKRWDMAGGAHLAGLAHRRAEEDALFEQPDQPGATS